MSDEIQELIARHNHIVAGIEKHGMIKSHRQRITGALNSIAKEFENLLSVQDAQLDYYKDDLDKIRAMVDAKEGQSTVEAVRAAIYEQPWREDEKDDPNYGRVCLCGAAIRAGGRIYHTCTYTDDGN
tara:strand:+ start:384 stop:764 length:381 start_codon:yes stop_codon:yes gene_type:complete